MYRTHIYLLYRNSSGTLQFEDVARHVTSKDVMQILEVEMISLYIVDPLSPNVLYKYNIRSDKAEKIDLNVLTHKSAILFDVLQEGITIKHSSVRKSSVYNEEIDGCPGLVLGSVMYIPLKDQKYNDR